MPVVDAVMGSTNYGAITAKAALELLGVLDNRTRPAARWSPADDDARSAPACAAALDPARA